MTESGFLRRIIRFLRDLQPHLRALVEGLFGVRFHLLDGLIRVAPNLPREWEQAELTTAAVAVGIGAAARRRS